MLIYLYLYIYIPIYFSSTYCNRFLFYMEFILSINKIDMMCTLSQALSSFCFVILSFHPIEQCRHTQNKKEKKRRKRRKKSEIQHAQSHERERLLVQKNCTVLFVFFFLFCANRTYKKKERERKKERKNNLAVH